MEAVEAVMRKFKKAVIGRGNEPPPELCAWDAQAGRSNHRNGISGKTVLTQDGPLCIEIPRDRQRSFEPQLIGKHEGRFYDQIIALYARHDGARNAGVPQEMDAVEVIVDFISSVTDAVMIEVTA